MVRWLGRQASTEGGTGLITTQGTKIHPTLGHRPKKRKEKKKKSPSERRFMYLGMKGIWEISRSDHVTRMDLHGWDTRYL